MRRLSILAAAVALLAASDACAAVAPDNPYIRSTSIVDGSANQTGIGSNPLIVSRGASTTLNISASTLIAAGAHRVATVCVVTAGSTAGTVNDSATTGGAAAANAVAGLPNAVGCYALDFPVTNGLVVVPGTSQVVAVAWN